MKSLFELLVQDVLPTARSLIAKKLISDYGLSQKQAAEKLGISQPAISQYNKNIRGVKNYLFQEKDATDFIDDLTKKIANNEVTTDKLNYEFLELMKFVKPDIEREDIISNLNTI